MATPLEFVLYKHCGIPIIAQKKETIAEGLLGKKTSGRSITNQV